MVSSASLIYFLTTSFISLMWSLALFAHGVPSSRALSIIPIVLENCFTSEDSYLLAMSHTMASGPPIFFANCLTSFACCEEGIHEKVFMDPLVSKHPTILVHSFVPALDLVFEHCVRSLHRKSSLHPHI